MSSAERTHLAERYLDDRCEDGRYQADVLYTSEEIEFWVHKFDPANSVEDNIDIVKSILRVRYPHGVQIIESAEAFDSQCGKFWMARGMDIWGDDEFLFHELVLTAGLIVHECGHGWNYDASESDSGWYTFFLSENYTIDVRLWPGDKPRTLIYDDFFSSQVVSNVFDDTYISPGAPTSASGFVPTLDEWLQYNRSLAVAYAFHDYIRYANAIDGVLTFIWYNQRYLFRVRNMYPEVYHQMMSDRGTRKTILWLWGQSWRLLEHALEIPQLGSKASSQVGKLFQAVQNPMLLREIQRVRVADGCATQ
ncbi:MAG: hypothetical protein KTR25_15475 [Myxococcales bacterium]|nr:hypothetical protein [Myxococcales bacterium]